MVFLSLLSNYFSEGTKESDDLSEHTARAVSSFTRSRATIASTADTMVSTGAYILSAGSNARELLQIPLIPGDVVDVPQDQLPQDQLSEGVELLSTLDSGDTAWMLTSTILVLMMTIPGLALFYGGLVRPKNVLNAASNVFATVALVTLVWVLWGYSIAFSDVEMEKGRYNLHSFF